MLYYYNWFVYFKHLAHTHMCSMRWAVNYFILFVYTEEKKYLAENEKMRMSVSKLAFVRLILFIFACTLNWAHLWNVLTALLNFHSHFSR